MKKSGINFAVSCLLFASTVVAQTKTSDAVLTANPVYEKNCAKCHGKTAEGRHFGGPALKSDKVAPTSADELSHIINNGKGRMPRYASKLTQDEIGALVTQIQALNKK